MKNKCIFKKRIWVMKAGGAERLQWREKIEGGGARTDNSLIL